MQNEWGVFPTILAQGAPSLRYHFGQKEAYLDTSIIVARVLGI